MSLTTEVIDKLQELTKEFNKPPVQKPNLNLDNDILKGLSGASKAQSIKSDNIAPASVINSKQENPGKGRG